MKIRLSFILSALILFASSAQALDKSLIDLLHSLNASPDQGIHACQSCIAEPPATASPTPSPLAFDCNKPFTSMCREVVQKPEFKELQTRGLRLVREAVKDAAKKLGAKNLDEALSNWFKKQGLTVITPAESLNFSERFLDEQYGSLDDPKPLGTQKKDPIDYVDAFAPKELSDCGKLELNKLSPEELVKQQALFFNYREVGLKHFSPAALFETLLEYCESADGKDDSDCAKENLAALNEEIREAHADKSNTDDLRKRLLSYNYGNPPIFDPKKSYNKEELDKLIKRVSDLCTRSKKTYGTALRHFANSFRTNISASQPVVTKLQESFYSPQSAQLTQAAFEEARSHFLKFFKETISPKVALTAPELEKIESQIKTLPLMLPQVHTESDFTEDNALGFKKLKKKDINNWTLHGHSFDPFEDASLNVFTDHNAVYSMSYSNIEHQFPEFIEVNPYDLLISKSLDSDLFRTFTHEFGHKLDLTRSSLHNKAFAPLYSKLAPCLSKHLGLKSSQLNEAIADWISAECLSQKLAQISESERKQYIYSLDKLTCQDVIFSRATPEALDESHPHRALRMNRIFGRNPDICKAFGCPVVPHCTLDGEVK